MIVLLGAAVPAAAAPMDSFSPFDAVNDTSPLPDAGNDQAVTNTMETRADSLPANTDDVPGTDGVDLSNQTDQLTDMSSDSQSLFADTAVIPLADGGLDSVINGADDHPQLADNATSLTTRNLPTDALDQSTSPTGVDGRDAVDTGMSSQQEQRPKQLIVDGSNATAPSSYDIDVSGDLEKVTSNETTDVTDTVQERRVSGVVEPGGRDKYRFTGELLNDTVTGDATVDVIDSQSIDADSSTGSDKTGSNTDTVSKENHFTSQDDSNFDALPIDSSLDALLGKLTNMNTENLLTDPASNMGSDSVRPTDRTSEDDSQRTITNSEETSSESTPDAGNDLIPTDERHDGSSTTDESVTDSSTPTDSGDEQTTDEKDDSTESLPTAQSSTDTQSQSGPSISDGAGVTQASSTGQLESSRIEELMHQQLNTLREQQGVQPLQSDGDLAAVARAHSQDMAQREYFAHQNPDGQQPVDRFKAAGGSGCQGYGENLAWVSISMADGSNSGAADALMEQLRTSSTHRENMLSSTWTHEGVGVYVTESKIYATQNFCRAR